MSTIALMSIFSSSFTLAPSLNLCVEHRSAVMAVALPDCPLSLPNCPFSPTPSPAAGEEKGETSSGSSPSPPALSLLETASSTADRLEVQALEALGLTQPLACTAAEIAIDTLVRASCEELGSLSVTVNATSSAKLILGEVDFARVIAENAVGGGLRVSSAIVEATNVRVDLGNLLASPPELPNLARAVPVGFTLRLTQDDINRSPVLFAALQEVLRELLRSGMSAAIGEMLPRDNDALSITLDRVEAMQAGRIVLVASAEATQRDGSTLKLDGLRVRTTPRVAPGSQLLVLDLPELLSSFEGFGAKLEVGLPFLRGAGIPLPDALRLASLTVDEGAIVVRGSLVLSPLDYDDIGRALQELQAAAAQQPPQPVVVDAEFTRTDASSPPSPPTGSLPAAS